MSSPDAAITTPPRRFAFPRLGGGAALSRGVVITYLGILVLLPLAAVIAASGEEGLAGFWKAVTNPQAVASLRLTLIISLVVVLINSVVGTLIAWVLVRDDFRGKSLVNSIIDLPFALPTIVAGLVLMALYGDNGVLGLTGVSYTSIGITLALLFVTLPFVVRAVQPTLLELDTDMEEAAASLGAKPLKIFRSVIIPNLAPAILGGAALAFARAVGEFGSVILISGNIPFDTEVSSVYIFGQIESYNITGAAAVSVVLLALSVGVLALFQLLTKWSTRHVR